jgi:hypothetical protein
MHELTFKRGNQVGKLMLVMVEMGSRYQWRQRLALVDDQGHWLYTEHWRSNAIRKAQKAIEELGYVLVS